MNSNQVLEASFFANNRARLRELFGGTAPIVITGNKLLQKSADSAYPFVQDSNFWYLTGVPYPGLTLVMDGSREYIILPLRDGVREAFDGEIDTAYIAQQSGIKDIREAEIGWTKLEHRLNKAKHVATLQPAPPYIEALGMYTNPSRASLISKLQGYNGQLDLIDLRSQLATLRVVKTPEELEIIKEAVKETVSLYQLIEKKWTTATHEYEILANVQKHLTRNQLELAYDPIIASGKNSLTLHYIENNAPLDPKGFLLLDIGVRKNGYCADVTRSVVNDPTKRQQAVYDAVLAVHEFACSLLKPGTSLVTYEEAVLQYMGEKLRELGLIRTINKETVRKFYPHSTSHFLGIDVHDAGAQDTPLVPGIVLTVEPGIYIQAEGIGIRLEDTVVITENGNDNLSEQLPKDISSLTMKQQ